MINRFPISPNAAALAGLLLFGGGAWAERYEAEIRPFFEAHCVRCHGAEEQESDLRLDTLPADFGHPRNAEVWVEVMDNLNLGEMPPVDEPQPEAGKAAAVAAWIAESLEAARREAHAVGGESVMRRLNRVEYANTVRDLFGLEFVEGEGPEALLPPDGKVDGFTTVATGLLLDPSLMESYYAVANRVAAEAVRTEAPEFPERTVRYDYEAEDFETDLKIEPAADGMLIYNAHQDMVNPDFNGRALPRFGFQYPGAEPLMIPQKARYRIRVRAGADAGQRGEPLFLTYFSKKDGAFFRQRIEAPLDAPEVYEGVVTLNPQPSHDIRLQIAQVPWYTTPNARRKFLERRAAKANEAGDHAQNYHFKARQYAEGDYYTWQRTDEFLRKEINPKLYVDYVELEGPLHPNWPSPFLTRYFPRGFDPASTSREEVAEAFRRFLPEAYRRPVTEAEVEELLEIVDAELAAGENLTVAVQAGVATALCSPHFLFLAQPDALDSPGDFALASRLSYFLWSSMPDRELRELAAAGKLGEPETLREQIGRMLADERAEGFIRGFASQWLKVDEFDRFTPDKEIYRKYHREEFKGIAEDLKEQPLAFIRTLLQEDGNLLDLFDSDWTTANARLADYYGLSPVEGDAFRRVSLPAASPRGGLLGMAGVHQWGSDGNRTKPVERAKYVREVLFNDPPDPPPPNVGEVEPNIEGENLTVRERLLQHQEIASCAACHQRLDPYGLALENFNVIGEWRDQADGEGIDWGGEAPALDVSGTLPNGVSFDDFGEYKQALAAQDERFLRGLSEKLFLYALGRTPTAADRPLIDHLVTSTREDQYRLRTMLTELIVSETFRSN